ncbi:CBS domain-containing protein [Larsenimonas rhizosphaerae]|uniref:CBS domain-containing protein n=1 Tax=Larsenimonas rhizosphaerae TaxID=2944682 RepID=A0AA41ZJN3_9GAMM|nr:CBS domain-containing protein [Larsenimonas rhizosphaerae]MCM2130371.1 CBS domain-containing protein [Larsenimonas rhizosphaerae]MCX2523076.1 CBS domain-containing protein [Larsenimonas rhizosphaerae]
MATESANYSALHLSDISDVHAIARPKARTSESALDMDSSALTLLTDFTQSRAQTVPASARANQALAIMKNNQVHMLLVLDADGRFTGLVSARQLFGGRDITVAMNKHAIERDEVTVDMVKVRREELHALALNQLEKATLGDLVKTLHQSGDRHILIKDDCSEDGCRIRGVISAADVSHALGIDLDHPPEAHSFSAICSVVLGHDL